MFFKGTMKEKGIDITIRNNVDHVLSPDSLDMVIDMKFEKLSPERFKEYYLNLLKQRWGTRQPEFLELAKEGMNQDINLLCYCPKSCLYCHAKLAADFMNTLIKKLKAKSSLNNSL